MEMLLVSNFHFKIAHSHSHAYAHANTHTYTQTHVHACTQTHIHTHTCADAGAVIHTHSKAAVLATLLYPGSEFSISHQEMIKGIGRGKGKPNLRYYDNLVVPIIENTPEEKDLLVKFKKYLSILMRLFVCLFSGAIGSCYG